MPSLPVLLLTSATLAAPSRPATSPEGCTLETEDLAALSGSLRFESSDEELDRAEAALDRHHIAHGWDGWIHREHPFGFEPATTCDPHVLHALRDAALVDPAPRVLSEALKVAAVLERNGRWADARSIREAYGHFTVSGTTRWRLDLAEARLEAGDAVGALYLFSNVSFDREPGCYTLQKSPSQVVEWMPKLAEWPSPARSLDLAARVRPRACVAREREVRVLPGVRDRGPRGTGLRASRRGGDLRPVGARRRLPDVRVRVRETPLGDPAAPTRARRPSDPRVAHTAQQPHERHAAALLVQAGPWGHVRAGSST